MHIQLPYLYLAKATCIATSSTFIMVWVKSWLEASTYVVVDVGECMTKAPESRFGGCRG